ncbi:MAG: hypothetical protein LAO20_12350 [Acidobacteriia bacterium]|nr:hypothetical protein [Terriglobia bacterium]
MKTRVLAVLLSLSTFTGCLSVLNARLYPVKGPLAAQVPTPVFAAQIAIRENGDISLTLADGETARGHWAEVTSNPSLNREMAPIWDAIYGQGFYMSNVRGSQLYARATVNGSKGTVLNVEFFRNIEQHYRTTCFVLSGVAKDNNGNTYKLMIGNTKRA